MSKNNRTESLEMRDWVEVKLIRQEHRLINVLQNYLRYRKVNNERLAAARYALAWKIASALLPTVAFGGLGVTAVFGLIIASNANNLFGKQNELIATQSQLLEGQRRSTQIFELTSILDELQREQNKWYITLSEPQKKMLSEHKKKNRNPNISLVRRVSFTGFDFSSPSDVTNKVQKKSSQKTINIEMFRPSTALLGRMSALSRSLRPYKYLDVEGDNTEKLITDPVSPERAQLLITLLNADFSTAFVDGFGIIFDYADLSSIELQDTLIENKSLNFSNFVNSDLSYSSFSGSFLIGAKFENTTLRGTNFNRATLPGPQAFKGAVFDQSTDFYAAVVDGEDWVTRACVGSPSVKEFFCNKWKIVKPGQGFPIQEPITEIDIATQKKTYSQGSNIAINFHIVPISTQIDQRSK